MRRLLLTFITLILVFCLGSCGGSQDATQTTTPQLQSNPAMPDEAMLPGETAGNVVVEKAGFCLTVLDDSFAYGGSAEFDLTIRQAGAETEVAVSAQADGLKIALFELAYDDTVLNAVECAAGDWPGLGSDDLLTLAIADAPGCVHYGALIPRPQEADGVSGEFTLATVRFADGPAAPRTGSAVPDFERSAIRDLEVDLVTGDVTFSHVNLGDYNQNSLVEVADITPLGVHFAEQSATFPGLFPWESIGSVIDGNENGLIEIADLTPIGQNWQKQVVSWRLYGGDIADYPDSSNADNGAAAELAVIPFPAASVLDTRLVIEESVTPAVGDWSDYEALWLRPVGSQSDEGTPSNMFDVPDVGDVTPPVWDSYPEDPDGEGIVEVIPLDGAARVMWRGATDAGSPPVSYTVYYNEGMTVDFATAATLSVTISEPPDANADQIREITGLTNGMEYAFAVRAQDSAAEPNEDDNENTITVTPLATAEVPAALTAETTFNGPMVISSGNTVALSGGECIHFMSDLTIETGAMLGGQNEDMCLIVHGDLYCDGLIQFTVPWEFATEQDANSLKLVLMGAAEFGANSAVISNGNVYIVDDPDELLTPEDVETETDNDTDPDEYPFNLMPEDAGTGGGKGVTALKSTSRTVYYGPRPWQRWVARGNWGQMPAQPRNVHRVVMRIHQANGQLHFEDFSIEGPPGQDGQDQSGGCNVTGGDGEDNRFRLRIHASRRLTFNNVTIKLGDGGDGGDAETDLDCCPTAVATGGKGGKPLNKFRFTAAPGGSIEATGAFNFNPGHGGTGGDATASAGNGEDGCPPEEGCSATATGGDGGEMPRWGLAVRGNVSGLGNVTMGEAKGGTGGAANAIAGDGGDDTCDCPDGVGGGDGGPATATGGNGGDATGQSIPAGVNGGGVTSGDGGSANAFGGYGGNGLTCYKEPGSDGGDGGDATANSGTPGTATGSSATQGSESAADAIGGDGGDGGDGCDPGNGGEGGTATANGNPGTATDGDPGADGIENPPGCIIIWCIPIISIVSDPSTPSSIPDGFSGTAPLLSYPDMLPVGTVPFSWDIPVGWNIWWDYGLSDPPPPTISADSLAAPPETEPARLNFDLGGVALDEGQIGGFMGAELGIGETFSESTDPPGEQRYVDNGTLAKVAFEPITQNLSGATQPQTFDTTPDSFFDITYQIEFNPLASHIEIEWIYIIDP
ncbi:fibronectin type III domain-containing protein [bacterium]|nr:fibronectin type III domain-containing protein [bacterium]